MRLWFYVHVENFIQVEFDTMHRKLAYQKKKKKGKPFVCNIFCKKKKKAGKKNICQVGAALDPSTLPWILH